MNRQKPPGALRGGRTTSSLNLGRLADAVGMGILASSLGVGEYQLAKVIRGEPDAFGYQVHIAHLLSEAGLPPAWLDQPKAKIRPEFVKELRRLAGRAENTAPLRRQNMRKLANAVGGGATELADLLDMTEHSLESVLQGRLPIDDERFNHINPQLMGGGFPNGWLDEPQAAVNPDWIRKLRTASGSGESESREFRAEAARQPASSQSRAYRDRASQSSPTSTNETERAFAMETSPSTEDPTTLRESTEEASPAAFAQPLETRSAGAEEGAAGQGARAKRRGSRAGKRVPAADGAAAEVVVPTTDDEAVAGPQSDGEPGAAESMPEPPLRRKPGRRKAVAPSPTPIASQEPDPDGARMPRTPISREESLKRAEALERLLSTARRGAKVTLWRDLLGLSLPYWGNIRRGSLLLRDELAERITDHMGLAKGWLDQPSFPPAEIADWVMDAAVPLPTALTRDVEPQAGSETAVPPSSPDGPNPTPRKKAPLRKAAVALRRAAEPEVLASGAGQSAAPDTLAAASVPEPMTADLGTAPAPLSQLPAEATSPSAAAAEGSTFSWSPAKEPEPRSAPGPLVEALSLVIGHLSLKGEFTDDDALRMLAMFSAKR